MSLKERAYCDKTRECDKTSTDFCSNRVIRLKDVNDAVQELKELIKLNNGKDFLVLCEDLIDEVFGKK